MDTDHGLLKAESRGISGEIMHAAPFKDVDPRIPVLAVSKFLRGGGKRGNERCGTRLDWQWRVTMMTASSSEVVIKGADSETFLLQYVTRWMIARRWTPRNVQRWSYQTPSSELMPRVLAT